MVSQGGYFRASVRRAVALPPVWLDRARVAPVSAAMAPAPAIWPDWPDAPLPIKLVRTDPGAVELPAIEPRDWPDAPLPIEDVELIAAGGCAPAIVAPIAKPAGREPKTERNAQIVAAYVGGQSAREIGRAFGVDPARVYQLLKAAGVQARPRGGNNRSAEPKAERVTKAVTPAAPPIAWPFPVRAPAPRPRPAVEWDLSGRAWCSQCEQRVTAARAAACNSPFCKVKAQ